MEVVNKSGIIPVGNTILVYPDPIEEKTSTGIYVGTPGEIERLYLAQTEGTVVEIGPEAYYDEKTPRCKVGDRVVFAKYSGMLRDGNEETKYRLIHDTDVVAILTDNKG